MNLLLSSHRINSFLKADIFFTSEIAKSRRTNCSYRYFFYIDFFTNRLIIHSLFLFSSLLLRIITLLLYKDTFTLVLTFTISLGHLSTLRIMANPIETIVQAYVATVASQPNNEQRDVIDISVSELESSSSSSANNNVPNLQSYSNRSFFRRAWDKVESIFVQKDANLPTYYNNYEREDDEDDDTSDEFVHPNPYQQPLTRTAMFRPPVHKRRLSQHSDELITAGPSDYSPRSSSEWPTRQRYEDWQRDQGEPDIEELNNIWINGYKIIELIFITEFVEIIYYILRIKSRFIVLSNLFNRVLFHHIKIYQY
ncbi:hypothetical protein GLOIN_2v1694152 [Rhizophagus clarus]|uniref:Uncharacterized protein n=1 Tax=Rhizophagus clarus TaxID=94130 RepID=A0A8H3QJL8_9GLOM|nr:hypothetical protein GLOIN_2v1694152 [Rhizophagus clarus]